MIKIVNAESEVPENLEGNKRVIKVNLPESVSKYHSGNGEGIWAYIRHEADVEKYDKGIGQFEVVLLNQSINYIGRLKWADVVMVEGRGEENRPVLTKEWFEFLQ